MKSLAYLLLLPTIALSPHGLWGQGAESMPSPIREGKFSAAADFGNRWVSDVGGSQDVYRSIVNLGEGPKLFGGELRYRDPAGKLFDTLHLTGNSWGGDPYSTARLDAEKSGAYSLRFDYRNIAYFNSLPSFANPLLNENVFLSQRAIDIRRRQIDTDLEIRPGSSIVPFFSFARSSGFGRGVTTFVSDGNEFPVGTDLDDAANTFRGGVRLNFSRFNVTLEQGHTSFSDEQAIVFQDGGNRGNRRTTLLGRSLLLDELRQAYDVRGGGPFSRAALQARPWTKLRFTGQFLYSRPSLNVITATEASGKFLLLRAVAPFTGLFERSLGDAERPHSSGSWNTEFRPQQRLRIIQSFYTDRFHVSGGSLLAQTLDTAPERQTELETFETLVLNYNRHQVDVMYDLRPAITLRGGHRYVWGDAEVREPTLRLSPHLGELRRHVGLAGARVKVGAVSVNVDFEASPGDQALFRTSLMEYQRGKIRVRYRLSPSMTVNGSFSILNNQNPSPDVEFDLRSRQSSVSVLWTPSNNSRFSVLTDYTRSTIRTDLPIVVPPFLQRELARYRDRGHHGGAYVDVKLYRSTRVGFGGSLSINAGSRPTKYYQPRVRLAIPFSRRGSWISEWRWYGFFEDQLAFENFRTHVFSTGVRLEL